MPEMVVAVEACRWVAGDDGAVGGPQSLRGRQPPAVCLAAPEVQSPGPAPHLQGHLPVGGLRPGASAGQVPSRKPRPRRVGGALLGGAPGCSQMLRGIGTRPP